MDSDIVGSILLQVVLIAVNAVFACAEIAVVSCNDAKLEKMAQEGNKRAAKLFHLTEQPSRFLATIQVVITLSGFLGSAFAAENFSDRIVSALVDAGMKIPEKTLDAIAVVLITLLCSFAIIPSGYTGVRTTFGQIDAVTVANGFTAKIPYVQSIKRVNNKQQEVSLV